MQRIVPVPLERDVVVVDGVPLMGAQCFVLVRLGVARSLQQLLDANQRRHIPICRINFVLLLLLCIAGICVAILVVAACGGLSLPPRRLPLWPLWPRLLSVQPLHHFL